MNLSFYHRIQQIKLQASISSYRGLKSFHWNKEVEMKANAYFVTLEASHCWNGIEILGEVTTNALL